MPLRQPLDFLIIGQGLAGSLLAWSLLQRGHMVVNIPLLHHPLSLRERAGRGD